jgi:hypothetical protein
MKHSVDQDQVQTRGRNIALGAGLGLLIGGGLDLILGDGGWGIAIGILIGAIAGYWINFPLPVMQYPPQIIRQIFLAAVIFFVFLFGSQWLLDQDFSQSYNFLIAVAPAVPAAAYPARSDRDWIRWFGGHHLNLRAVGPGRYSTS